MSDLNAEMAFLQAMQAGPEVSVTPDEPALESGQDADEDEEDYDPSNLNYATAGPADLPTPNVPRSPPSESASHDPSRAASTVSDTRPVGSSSRQPRTMGGFVVDDEDDEDDENPLLRPNAAVANGLMDGANGSLLSQRHTLSHSPGNTLTAPDVSVYKAVQENDASSVTPIGVADIVHKSVVVPADNGASSKNGLTSDQPPTVSVSLATPPIGGTMSAPLPKARLPQDRVGILEDRIAEDPRGDIDAWMSLIGEHRRRNKLEDARSVYDRFFKIFPSAAELWVAYANMELQNDDFYRVEQIFSRSLLSIPNVQLWSIYLDYVRRRNNLSADPSGSARQIVSQAYDFVLQNIGVDKDAGQIWQDYVHFVRSGPGNIGGSGWQDQQKMDMLRKAYQRAICVPTQSVNALWKEYDQFEMGLNKITGRKFLQEKSPAYMTARSSYIALQNITRDLKRTTIPRLPPALGFDGDIEYLMQVDLWKKWIAWEKDDPLVLKDEDVAAYRGRVVYVYKQALMALRFWPEMWFEAAEFCFENEMESDGNDFLNQGIAANPESCLLAFKRADRIELTTASEEGEESVKARGDAVREPYDKVLDALYDLINVVKERENRAIARIKDSYAQQHAASPAGSKDENEEEEEAAAEGEQSDAREMALKAQTDAIQKGSAAQIKLLSRTISFAWIALMRAMRRVQGKGKVGDPVGGSRQVFSDARKKGRITSDVYVASALIEYHCYKDPAATKIFERGVKLFPTDETFALEYLKHLMAINDITNARAVFETTVSKLAQKPETLTKAKPIYAFFHEYESQYGELSQVSKLEKRMSDLFPEDPLLARFSHRFAAQGFDPTAVRPIISPATQARPKQMPTVERPTRSVQNSPKPLPAAISQITNSPKRPFLADESESETLQPRKIARGESPLKGAAGRRLVDAKRSQQRADGMAGASYGGHPAPPPPELPREVLFLLSIIPPARTYKATVFSAPKMVDLLRRIDLSRANAGQTQPSIPKLGQVGYVQQNYPFPFNR